MKYFDSLFRENAKENQTTTTTTCIKPRQNKERVTNFQELKNWNWMRVFFDSEWASAKQDSQDEFLHVKIVWDHPRVNNSCQECTRILGQTREFEHLSTLVFIWLGPQSYLDKVSSDKSQLCLWSRKPDSLNDKITGLQLRMKCKVIHHRPWTAECQHMTILQPAHC